LIKIDKQDYRSALISRVHSEGKQSTVRVIKGNGNHREHFSDFDVEVSFMPLKILYQLVPITKLIQFLKVEDFDDQLAKQALDKIETLKQSVSLSDVIKRPKRNKLRVNIAAPILIVPFKKNNDVNTECWILNMGNLAISNGDGKSYRVEISEIMMKYCSSYRQWM